MDDLITTILYGRAEQGVETATRRLGDAAFRAKNQTQDFVVKGMETVGFPVRGTVKVAKSPIVSKQEEQGDFVVLCDMQLKDAAKYCKDRATIIYNSIDKMKFKDELKQFHVPATQIYLDRGRTGTVALIMLGAFAKVFGKIPLKYFKAVLDEHGENYGAFEEGAHNVKRG